MRRRQQGCAKKDVIRVKAKKYESPTSPETKTFSVDPELTNFATLREILIKAFNIKEEFVISYLVNADQPVDAHYLPMLSEWDFNTAVYAASEPFLGLKIDARPRRSPADWEEWDIIDDDDVVRLTSPTASPCIPVFRETYDHLDKGPCVNTGDKEIRCQPKEKEKYKKNKPKIGPPMTESVFKSYLDAEGRLLDSNAFREAVYQSGLDPTARHSVWPHLLNVYPAGLTMDERQAYEQRLCEKYNCLKESWQGRFKRGLIDEELRLVANSVRKDVIRTDRILPFFAGDEDRNENLLSLFNILTTYAMAHPEVSYCQGMSDLASPLLTVMKDEAVTYLCFCALMRRMRENFSCDGWTMTRKFHHLSELVHYYDPTFYEYLREMHSEDLLFAYRWLLLELKREFAFDDVLILMEVTWASLPSSPTVRGCEMDLYDIDLTAICGDESSAPCRTVPDWTASMKEKLPSDVDQIRQNGVDAPSGPSINAVSSFATRFRPISGPPTVHSCPGMLACSGGVCPALVVRSLMLDYKESKRLHEIRHASYPTRPNKLAMDDVTLNQGGRRGQKTRFTIGCLTEDLKCDIPVEKESGSSLEPIDDTSGSASDEDLVVNSSDDEDFVATVGGNNGPERSAATGADGSGKTRYCLRPSPELKVSDTSGDGPQDRQPVPMAAEAYLDFQSDNSDALENELTLTRIHEICLSNIPTDDSAVPSSKSSSACVSRRSREPSGGNSNLQHRNSGLTSLAFTATDVSQFTTRRSSVSNAAATTTDSGIFEAAPPRKHAESPDRISTGSGLLIDINEFVNIDRDPAVSLPPPHELGDGNPFMLFVCLALILQHRDSIMKSQLDFNDIAVYFDKLMRKHDVRKILNRARILYANYLPRNSCMEQESNLGISKAVAMSIAKYVER